MTIDEYLNRLEDDIRRLKIEFDIFFNGGSKRPPYDTKGRVDSIIKRLADDRSMTFAQRFRYNSLVSRDTSFKELWRRHIQSIEEGVNPNEKLAGTFAERPSAVGAAAAPTVVSPPPQPKQFSGYSVTCSDPQMEVDKIITLYNAVIDAKRQCGEPTDKLSFEQFHKIVVAQSNKLKAQFQCPSINFSVEIEQGQVKFKAKGSR